MATQHLLTPQAAREVWDCYKAAYAAAFQRGGGGYMPKIEQILAAMEEVQSHMPEGRANELGFFLREPVHEAFTKREQVERVGPSHCRHLPRGSVGLGRSHDFFVRAGGEVTADELLDTLLELLAVEGRYEGQLERAGIDRRDDDLRRLIRRKGAGF